MRPAWVQRPMWQLRSRQSSCKARTDSDLRCLYRHSDHLYLHSFHYPFQWCSTRWFSQRSATHPTCFDKRNSSSGSIFVAVALFFLCIQQHLGKLLLRRGQYTLPHPSKMDTEHLSLISKRNGTVWGIGNIGYGMGAGRHHYGLMTLCNLIAISLLGKYAFKLWKTIVCKNKVELKILYLPPTD